MRKLKSVRSAWNDYRAHVFMPFEHEDDAKGAFYAGAAWSAGRLKEEAEKTLNVVVEKLCEQKK